MQFTFSSAQLYITAGIVAFLGLVAGLTMVMQAKDRRAARIVKQRIDGLMQTAKTHPFAVSSYPSHWPICPKCEDCGSCLAVIPDTYRRLCECGCCGYTWIMATADEAEIEHENKQTGVVEKMLVPTLPNLRGKWVFLSERGGSFRDGTWLVLDQHKEKLFAIKADDMFWAREPHTINLVGDHSCEIVRHWSDGHAAWQLLNQLKVWIAKRGGNYNDETYSKAGVFADQLSQFLCDDRAAELGFFNQRFGWSVPKPKPSA